MNHRISFLTAGQRRALRVPTWSMKAYTAEKTARHSRRTSPAKVPLPTTAASSRPVQDPRSRRALPPSRNLHRRELLVAMLGGEPQKLHPSRSPPSVFSIG